MDMLAEKIGMDPFEFRYQNIYRDGDITPNGDKFENIMYTRMFDLARPYYYACKERAKAESTDAVKRGVGVAPMFFIPLGSPKDKAEARIELKEDGRFYVYNTYHEMGQGGDIGSLAAALEVLAPLNLKPEDIQLDINELAGLPRQRHFRRLAQPLHERKRHPRGGQAPARGAPQARRHLPHLRRAEGGGSSHLLSRTF